MRYRPSTRESIALLIIWLACLVACMWGLGLAWTERLTFDHWGRTVPGEVLDISRPSTRSPPIATFHYTVIAPDGQAQTYINRRPITSVVGASVGPGGPITVVYLPDRPDVSDIAGNRYALLGDIAWSTVVLTPVALFCAALCWLSARELFDGLRHNRRAAHGP
jgi:hypothetical protein